MFDTLNSYSHSCVMMYKPGLIIAFGLLVSCGPDETISGFTDPTATYVLNLLNNEPFPARATIRFPQEGKIDGAGPCNSFQATQTAPYPWFEIGPIAATRMACPDLANESAYFSALGTMTISEVGGDVLILSNTEDGQMVFQAE